MNSARLPPHLFRTVLRDPLTWLLLLLLLLVFGIPSLRPVFAAAFPKLDRPIYLQDSFFNLICAHIELVLLSSALSTAIGIAAGTLVTRPGGREFRPMTETIVSIGQTFPPVAVLAIAAPLIGFGDNPALIALVLYGLLPIVHQTVVGIEAVPQDELEAAKGLGMTNGQIFFRVELPLAAGVILSGIRTSVIINIGTAAIASTVGAKSLGSPIIIGLSGFNLAYVIQGAVLVGLLTVTTDMGFERLARYLDRWRGHS